MRHAQCLKSKKQIAGWRASEQPRAMAPPCHWVVDNISSATHPLLIIKKKRTEILGQWEGRTIHLGRQPDLCSCAQCELELICFLKIRHSLGISLNLQWVMLTYIMLTCRWIRMLAAADEWPDGRPHHERHGRYLNLRVAWVLSNKWDW